MKRYLIMMLGCAMLTTVLAGCHTVRGAGEDVASAGHAVTRAAE